MAPRIVVVGAGVIGLSSALTLLTQLPDCDVTVVSDGFSPNTTSDIAAGMWGPHLMGSTKESDIIKWSRVSWAHFMKWHQSGDNWGVSVTPGTMLFDTVEEPHFWRVVPPDYRELTKEECREFGDAYQSGFFYSALIAQPSIFLPKLTEEIKQKGGKFKQQHLACLSEVCPDADIVVNCSGLGARYLVPDEGVVPIRGQVLRVRAPWITSYLGDESEKTVCYVLPNQDSVVLGGTFQEGDWNTDEDPATTQTILDRCCKLVPSLKDAEVLRCQVGLRPGRPAGVRLERDVIRLPGRTVPVVHNYGHGGCGVTLMWGCADEVAGIVRDIVGHSPGPRSAL